jgi:hypothetical protein
VPAASTAKKADLDDSSVMDFDFEDEDEAQPPL